MKITNWLIVISILLTGGTRIAWAAKGEKSAKEKRDFGSGEFTWKVGELVLAPKSRDGYEWYSVKDPSAVFHEGRWHLFCTLRGKPRSHTVEYLTFTDWQDANQAERHILPMHPGYFCAPQVFYFSPQKKWYLIFQASDESWEPKYQPAFSTNEHVTAWKSWSKPKPLFGYKPKNLKGWLDFWIICDAQKAHLFFTSLDGRMWRAETKLHDFPHGWSQPIVVLQGDVFEASHTYKLKGRDTYLTLIEAQHGYGWRYYKAYLADRLDGEWKELAATRAKTFASMKNVTQTSSERWTDSISHGELLRWGYDEKLEVDPGNLQFLFQGVTDKAKAGKTYGEIPWRLGILESQK